MYGKKKCKINYQKNLKFNNSIKTWLQGNVMPHTAEIFILIT